MRDLALLAIASLMMALPAYPQQSSASQAASGQSDNAALQQKIRDLEDRLIALEGQRRHRRQRLRPRRRQQRRRHRCPQLRRRL